MASAPLTWAGGKRQLLPQILARMPDRIRDYYEPFVGGGAVLVAVLVSGRVDGRVRVGDANRKLVALFEAIRDDVEGLIQQLEALIPHECDRACYYERRTEFNVRPTPALFAYLNAACYRGLYRENASGGFNVPFGSPKSFSTGGDNLRALSHLFRKHAVDFVAGPWQETVQPAAAGDFVYMDPPYTPLNAGSFTTYVAGGFGPADHEALVAWMKATHAGVLYSNHHTPAVLAALGEGWRADRVSARRAINCKRPEARTDEVLALKVGAA